MFTIGFTGEACAASLTIDLDIRQLFCSCAIDLPTQAVMYCSPNILSLASDSGSRLEGILDHG
jgi:hypothetical protein